MEIYLIEGERPGSAGNGSTRNQNRAGEFWFHKERDEMGVNSGKGSLHPPLEGWGPIPRNVENSLPVAHFTI